MCWKWADGIFFEETARLAKSSGFKALVNQVILTASDSAGALAGEHWLKTIGLTPSIIAGKMTSSPLAVREARYILNTPVLTLADINKAGLGG